MWSAIASIKTEHSHWQGRVERAPLEASWSQFEHLTIEISV